MGEKRKRKKNRAKSQRMRVNKSRSPRELFRNGQKSAKDAFGNILHRPQSSRTANSRPHPSYNIFRSRSPTASSVKSPSLTGNNGKANVSSPSGRDHGHSTQSFSFGSWKKKWAK